MDSSGSAVSCDTDSEAEFVVWILKSHFSVLLYLLHMTNTMSDNPARLLDIGSKAATLHSQLKEALPNFLWKCQVLQLGQSLCRKVTFFSI